MKNGDNKVDPEPNAVGLNLSFLLRVWTEDAADAERPSSWRYSLKDLKTKAQRGFANLESLQAYLEKMESEGTSTGHKSGTKQE